MATVTETRLSQCDLCGVAVYDANGNNDQEAASSLWCVVCQVHVQWHTEFIYLYGPWIPVPEHWDAVKRRQYACAVEILGNAIAAMPTGTMNEPFVTAAAAQYNNNGKGKSRRPREPLVSSSLNQ